MGEGDAVIHPTICARHISFSLLVHSNRLSDESRTTFCGGPDKLKQLPVEGRTIPSNLYLMFLIW